MPTQTDPFRAWHSGLVPSADALLGLLRPAWQALIAACFLAITALGVRRLAQRGPTRMTNAVLLTGALIVALAVLGTLAVSCAGPASPQSTAERRAPAR